MDVHVARFGQRFVWDSAKATSNFAKHGISFDQSLDVFLDPFYQLEDASVDGESRLAATGLDLNGRLLFVVHLELDGSLIRIVSARLAEPAEKRTYEELE